MTETAIREHRASVLVPPIDVFRAARRLRGVVRRTPLRRSARLSERAGGEVWLKLENEQTTGSFKLRGAHHTLATLPAEARARGVVASSAGNHGLGVAHAARALGIRATVFVPASAPEVKRRGIEALGAAVDASAPDYDAAHALALARARETGATFVDPCSGDALLAGQGTVALEIVEELPEVAQAIVPVGGAGLLGGVGGFLRAVAPAVRIVGAQGERTAAMARSLAAGSVVAIPSEPTLCDGLAGGIEESALEIGRLTLDDIVTVSERSVERAIAWMARAEGVVAEGAGAVGVAALLDGAVRAAPAPTVVIVSGGNIDPERHARALAAADDGA
jgi:threonine dehydratase